MFETELRTMRRSLEQLPETRSLERTVAVHLLEVAAGRVATKLEAVGSQAREDRRKGRLHSWMPPGANGLRQCEKCGLFRKVVPSIERRGAFRMQYLVGPNWTTTRPNCKEQKL
jgi:hypothetical protein